MKHLFPASLFFIFFVSCESKNATKEQIVAPSVLPTTTATNPISPAGDNSAILKSDASIVLNPQHGQPGHRCEIAVGAPLNAPVTSNNIQPTITPNPTVTPSNTDTKKIAPKSPAATAALNPQHGEPGHRCDIAVGAPLNSKPAQ